MALAVDAQARGRVSDGLQDAGVELGEHAQDTGDRIAADRLDDEALQVGARGAQHDIAVGNGCDQHRRHALECGRGAQACHQFEAVGRRHAHVQAQEVEARITAHLSPRRGAVLGEHDLRMAALAQHVLHREARDQIVIGDEDTHDLTPELLAAL
jgi:hypothetical protein